MKSGQKPGHEQLRLLQTLSRMQTRGLINIKFARASNGANSTEEVCAEINRMLDAPRVAETESL